MRRGVWSKFRPKRNALFSSFPGKRRGVTRQSVIDMGFRPIPGQKFIESAHGVAVRHALKDAFEIGERLDVIEPCGCYERADGSPPSAATVGAREQVVLAPQRDGPNRTLDRIVVGSIAVQETAKG